MIYDNYKEEVQIYMHTLEDSLQKKYGMVDPEWEISLRQIADGYQIYLECLDQVHSDGLIIAVKNGVVKHPLLPVLQTQMSYLQKLSNQFGLNIMAASKLRKIDDADTGQAFIDEFVK